MWKPCAAQAVGVLPIARATGGACVMLCRPVAQVAQRARRQRRHVRTTTRANGGLGEIGARDPTQQELEFGFQERVLFNGDTEHIRMIPSAARRLIALSGRTCTPVAADEKPLATKDAELFRKQVLDWKLVEEKDVALLLRRTYQVKDAAAGTALAQRITDLATAEGHSARTQVAVDNTVTVELSTLPIGGLSDNDFIIAAKVDALSLTDLLVAAKKRTYYF